MIRVTDDDTGDGVLLNPDHIVGVEYDYTNNATKITVPDRGYLHVRETVSEVDLLIQQYRRANS